MGFREDLEAERTLPKAATKIDTWLETLNEEDRSAFMSAIRQPDAFSHEGLARLANKHGAKITESTIRRYRSKLQEKK